jgi:outer membrane protein OmpA-like peptidoglycan-associated protein
VPLTLVVYFAAPQDPMETFDLLISSEVPRDRGRPARAVNRLAVLLCVGLLGAAPVPAVVPEPARPTPTSARLAGSVRSLEPRVRDLEPVVRNLVPSVRALRGEVREGERTTVTISADVLFDFDSADLTDAARRIVADLVPRIAAGDGDVLVVGHTDGIGTLAYNQDLSERRAAAVADVLRPGLPGPRTIVVEGRNFSEPVAPETADGQDDPRGRARNRRVAITFTEPAGR